MIRYLLQRALVSVPILFGVLLVTFLLFHVAGGDPALVMLGKNAKPREIENLRAELGLDRPLFWGRWRRTEIVPAEDFRRTPPAALAPGTHWDREGWLALDAGTRHELRAAWAAEPGAAIDVRIEWRGGLKVAGRRLEAERWTWTSLPWPAAAGTLTLEAVRDSALRQVAARRRQPSPFDSQFARVLGEVLRVQRDPAGRWHVRVLDFGRSLGTGEPVRQVLREGIGPSALLMGWIFLIELVLGVGLALVSAQWHDRFPDRLLVVGSVAGMSVSYLVFILLGQYLLAYRWNLFPVWGWESWRCAVLPVLVGVVSGLGGGVRYYRTVFLNEIYRDHVRTAVAKGAHPLRVLLRHVLPNALIPIITRVSVVLPFLFTGSLLLESFFGIPGLGYAGINALANGDVQLLKALVFVSAVLFLVANLLADLAAALVDPRVRLE